MKPSRLISDLSPWDTLSRFAISLWFILSVSISQEHTHTVINDCRWYRFFSLIYISHIIWCRVITKCNATRIQCRIPAECVKSCITYRINFSRVRLICTFSLGLKPTLNYRNIYYILFLKYQKAKAPVSTLNLKSIREMDLVWCVKLDEVIYDLSDGGEGVPSVFW